MTRVALLLIALFVSAQCIAQNRAVVRFVAEDLPPYHFINAEGKADGGLVVLAQALAAQANLVAEIEIMPMARVRHQFESQSNVALLSWLKTPTREMHFRFLGTMCHASASLIGLKKSPTLIQNLNAAKRYRTGTIRGYYSETFLKQHGFTEGYELVLVSNYESLWNLLFKGRIDLVLTNTLTLEKELSALELDPSAIEHKLILAQFPSELALAVNAKFPDDLAKRLQDSLAELRQNGQQQTILEKWKIRSVNSH
ncbi:transporter substrate-binding domain-containing protein [Pseudoalteromonas sp. SCSIO 43201]|uniref:transporter substrate-binding domain-containing protein n=1 Tax=Pseudoalteromonas sp. SCSIO 43201 TaxID=2822842 RepID=UPI002075D532|nr:transporter substrate-binding domain-containing protein [Pseudoalteromonas sp. SCSIO 43201]